HAVVHLGLRTLQRRADLFRLRDILAVAAERLAHPVEPHIAQVAARLLAIRIAGPAAVQADHDQDRDLVAHRGVDLHGVHAHRAVAVHHDHLLVGAGNLGADAERQTYAHRAERTG